LTVAENGIRHCPKCGSVRVRQSRRRGPIEGLLSWFGGEICRCHDCRARQAWFGITPIPIGNRDPQANPWTNIIVFVSGLVACVVLAWWVITRYTAISG
jgi:predicted RNA-binding Zn-ribbon protein involved in translation (DUF1610 family)